jgi:DNA-binding NtrC family response regulator
VPGALLNLILADVFDVWSGGVMAGTAQVREVESTEGEPNSAPLKLLVIDKDTSLQDLISAAISPGKVAVFSAVNPETALSLFSTIAPRVVILDLSLGGTRLLDRIIQADPGVDIIVTADQYSTEAAIEAIQKGACDFLSKPLDIDKLHQRLDALVAQTEERQRIFQLDQELVAAYRFQGIVGRSPAIMQLFANIRRVAPHFRTVLVTGATGTGKELAARALHQLSPASTGRFVVCNCSALVETLVESELFGYVKGAFTGAVEDKIGVFEYADSGTVFLDEIGELPLTAQAKLLRILQNHEVQAVGSPIVRPVNVRVIAATNRDLRSLVASGKFREDLYYRISMIEINLPDLSERREDLPLLQRFFVTKFASQYQKPVIGLTRRAQAVLARHTWPGNVRELENVIGSACMMAATNVIDVADLPVYLRDVTSRPDRGEPGLITLEELQWRHLNYVLQRVQGNKARAAEILGISRCTVYEILERMKKASRNTTARNSAKAPSEA